MTRVVVTDRAYEVILRYAQRELRGMPRRQHDGCREVQINDALHALLTGARFPGETISQTILRVLPTRTGGRR